MKALYAVSLMCLIAVSAPVFAAVSTVNPAPVEENQVTVAEFASHAANVGQTWCRECGRYVSTDGDFTQTPGSRVQPTGPAAATTTRPSNSSGNAETPH